MERPRHFLQTERDEMSDKHQATPADGGRPAILPTTLTREEFKRLLVYIKTPREGEAAAVADLIKKLVAHAVLREKVLMDLARRLENLRVVCAEDKKYADHMCRRYCLDKLAFMADTLDKAVIMELAEAHVPVSKSV